MVRSEGVRRLLLLVPLPLLVAFAAWGSSRAADHAGNALSGVIANVAAFVVRSAPAEEQELDIVDLAAPIPVAAPGATSAPSKVQKGKRKQPALFVSASTVLRIASTKVNLRGVPVQKQGARPAGLRLVGVSALGVGLADGDVLTRALGQPALSREAVVRAVLVARARRERVLEGEFYRGNERWVLQVEQPYPPEASAAVTGDGVVARVASR